MECIKKVGDVSKKYPELKDYTKQINDILDEPIDVKIAFLGEFNSGKTTLVNALLRKNLLPMFSTPTTAAITEIYATDETDVKIIKEYKDESGKDVVKEVSLENLSSEVQDTGDKKIKVFVPENNVIKKGYVIVDTPGIHSLNEMHDDITFGYLPFVDAAFILIDINQGAVPSSLKRFLKENLLGNNVLLSKIRFIINRIDTKPESSLEKIKQGFIESVSDLIPDPVFIMLSAKEALDGVVEGNREKIKKSRIEDFENFLTNYVYKEKQEIETKRKYDELKSVFSDMTNILTKKIEAFQFSDDEYREKIKDITQKQDEFVEKSKKLKKSFDEMRERVSDRLGVIIDKYVSIITDKLKDKKDRDIESDVLNMTGEIDSFLKQQIGNYFSEYEAEIEGYLPEYFDLEFAKRIRSVVDGIMQIASFLLVAWIFPGARAGIEAGEALAGASEVMVKKVFKNAKNKNSVASFAKKVGDLVRQIDPLEQIKRIILPSLLKGKVREKLESRIYNAVNLIMDDIEQNVVNSQLNEIKRKLDELDSVYNETKKEMKSKKFDAKKSRAEIQKDINIIKDCIGVM